MRLQAFAAAQHNRFFAQLDAVGRDAGIAHEFQKLPAAAANIENVPAVLEKGDVELLRAPYVFLRTAEAVCESRVVELRRGLARRRCRSAGDWGPAVLRHGRPLPYQPQLVVDQLFVLASHALQIRPEALLDLQRT